MCSLAAAFWGPQGSGDYKRDVDWELEKLEAQAAAFRGSRTKIGLPGRAFGGDEACRAANQSQRKLIRRPLEPQSLDASDGPHPASEL